MAENSVKKTIESSVNTQLPEFEKQIHAQKEIPILKIHSFSNNQTISPDREKQSDDIIEFLEVNGLEYIDKRANKGALWIVGGLELKEIVKKARKLGFYFRFREEGGRVTKYKPGWWSI